MGHRRVLEGEGRALIGGGTGVEGAAKPQVGGDVLFVLADAVAFDKLGDGVCASQV